jgi:hypothetical protein
MEWDLQGEAVGARGVGRRVAVEAVWAVLPPAQVDPAFVSAVGRRCPTSKEFPVQACAAQNAGPR